MIVQNVRLPTRGGLHDVIICGSRISELRPHHEDHAGSSAAVLVPVDGEEDWLIPGWIDLQVNDMEWLDSAMNGERKDKSDHAQRIEKVLEYQIKQGVTHMLLATLASPLDLLEDYLKGAMQVISAGKQGKFPHSCFGGCLVEGTFMNPDCSGCHNKHYIHSPSLVLAQQLITTGSVRILNVAPETGEEDEVLTVISEAKKAGVIVGVGHAKPHAVMLRKAIDAGCSYVIHLGNGPTGSSWKVFNDGGMMEEALRNDSLTVSVIADFVHVHPHLLRDWIARKEISRVIAVSDCAFATGLGSRKSFEVFGRSGAVSDDGTYLVTETSGCDAVKYKTKEKTSRMSDVACLFGSCVTMKQVFENVLNLMFHEMKSVYNRQHEAMSLHDAIRTAVAVCSSNPARLLGIDHVCGTVQAGLEATLLLVNISEETLCPGEKWYGCNWQQYVTVTLKKVIYRGNLLDAV